jgi:DNA-3-methyladenine glycosylase I
MSRQSRPSYGSYRSRGSRGVPVGVATVSGMEATLHVGADGVTRCWWCADDDLYQRYHDTEWGHTLHGENKIFEKITLEGMQAGLSWITILRKRENFRAAFSDFDIESVAGFTDADHERLMNDAGIVRNRLKIDAAISNARVALAMLDAGESLDEFAWSFAPEKKKHRNLKVGSALIASTPESTAMSKALLKKGFRFVGPTTMYAFMQSSGMVDDHIEGCERR